jgi:hypothetical protein
VLFYALAIITTGVTVPSGLFVPCILCGASYGRAVGFLMTELYPVCAPPLTLPPALAHAVHSVQRRVRPTECELLGGNYNVKVTRLLHTSPEVLK